MAADTEDGDREDIFRHCIDVVAVMLRNNIIGKIARGLVKIINKMVPAAALTIAEEPKQGFWNVNHKTYFFLRDHASFVFEFATLSSFSLVSGARMGVSICVGICAVACAACFAAELDSARYNPNSRTKSAAP